MENFPDLFGAHMRTMRQMNSMMNTMFGDPFGFMDMGPPALTGASRALAPHTGSRRPPGGELMPFGFMNMNRVFPDFDPMGNNPNCHSYSSSTVMTMTSGPDGQPQVYQASTSTRTVPGGVKETKKTMCDSRTGVKKMAIGHHIGERGHVLEREHNLHSGDQEERQEFINLDEEEADTFNQEFEQRTRHVSGAAIGYNGGSRRGPPAPRRERENLRALPAATSTGSSRARSRGNVEHRRRNHPSLPAPSSSEDSSATTADVAVPGSSTKVINPSPSTNAGTGNERTRKRGHEPEGDEGHKAMKQSPQHG